MTFEVPVEEGKVRELARAAYSRDDAYQGPDAVVPPTFLATAAMFWEPPEERATADLGFDPQRVLHGEEEYVFFGALPRVGDRLNVESRLGKRWEKEGRRGGVMRFAQVIYEFRRSDGTLVAEQRRTAIETAARDTQ